MQDYAVGSPLPQKAVMLMFERISAQFAKRSRCPATSLDLPVMSLSVLAPALHMTLLSSRCSPNSVVCLQGPYCVPGVHGSSHKCRIATAAVP